MASWVDEKIELYEGELLVFKRLNSPMWYMRTYVKKERKHYQKSCKTKNKWNAIEYAKGCYRELQQKVAKEEKVFTISLGEGLKGYEEQEKERVARGLIGEPFQYQKEVYLRCKFAAFFGLDTQVNQISEELLEKYINQRMMETKRLTTIRTEISIIRHFFKTFLIKRGYVFKLPSFPEFRIRYKDRAKREDTFTIKEWQKLYKYMREWVKKKNVGKTRTAVGYYATINSKEKKLFDWEWQMECHRRVMMRELILICGNTGIRVPKEILSLKWRDVKVVKEKTSGDYNQGKEVEKLVSFINIGSNMKTGMRVVTGVCGEYFKRLKQYYRDEFDYEPKDNDFVFMEMFGRRKGDVFEKFAFYRLWRELISSAKLERIDFTPYCLRAFYITQSILNKIDLVLIAKNCGNSLTTIMKHYEFIQMENQTSELIKRRNIQEEISQEVTL